jgi:signal transduction histidine kinase
VSSVLDSLVGTCFCLFGLAMWRRTRLVPTLLMVATGVLWFIGGVVAWAVFAHRGPLIHLLVSYPQGRARDRTERATVVVGYLDALVYPLGRSDVATIALAALVISVAARGYRRARGARARARLTSLIASVAMMGVLAFGAAARMLGWHVDHEVLLASEITLIVISFVLFADSRWGRGDRAAIAGLAVDLGQEASGGSLRDRLANALGDPTLVLGYVVPGVDRLVDEVGKPMKIAGDVPGRTITPIRDEVGPIAVLDHETGVLDDPALLGSVAALTRIALANLRLMADVQTRVADVELSRRRLIGVADSERARLEAELQAGAQSRLEHVASLLAELPDDTRSLAALVAVTRDSLREFARGIHPRVLTESGLSPAINELASSAPLPVAVSVPDRRWHSDVEAAAYFVCAEALTNVAKYAHAAEASVRITQVPEALIVEISDDGIGGADPSTGSGLIGLSDRLDVLGGALDVDSPQGGGTRITARIPLTRSGTSDSQLGNAPAGGRQRVLR